VTNASITKAILTLIISIESPCIVPAGEALQNEPREVLARDILKAKTPFHLNAAYADMVGKATEAELRDLKNHKHAGIAIQSAWEELRRRTTTRQHGQATELGRQDVEAFLEIVRKRVPTNVPSWWTKVIYSGKWTGNAFAFAVDTYCPYHMTKSGFYAPKGTLADGVGSRLSITVDRHSFSISKSDVVGSCCREASLSATIGPKWQYLAIHPGECEPYLIFRVSPDSRKSSCFVQVWAGPIVYQTGIILPGQRLGQHAVSMEVGKHQLAVFGADEASIYLETFGQDGKNIFRFSSSFCDR